MQKALCKNRAKNIFETKCFVDVIKFHSYIIFEMIKYNHNLLLLKNYTSRLQRADVDPLGETTRALIAQNVLPPR